MGDMTNTEENKFGQTHGKQSSTDVHYKFHNRCNRTAGTVNHCHLLELHLEGMESSAVFNRHVPGISVIWSAKVQREMKIILADAKQTAVRKNRDLE